MHAQHTNAPVVGILAGGQGSRMGGVDKAALIAPDEPQPLLWRTTDLARGLGLSCVLIGAREPFERQRPELTYLSDDPSGVGPLGGLHALLRHAHPQPCILLACDMPFLKRTLLDKLAQAEVSGAPVLAPRESQTGKWQPFFARYESHLVAPVLLDYIQEGGRSFQGLFDRLAIEQLPLAQEEEALLADWDRPEDLRRRPLLK